MDVQENRVFCQRCGKRLKDTKSMEIGFGPTCYKKHLEEKAKHRRPLFTVRQRKDKEEQTNEGTSDTAMEGESMLEVSKTKHTHHILSRWLSRVRRIRRIQKTNLQKKRHAQNTRTKKW